MDADKTRNQRIAQVLEAADQLPAAIGAARIHPNDHERWEVVEQLAATIHRRSRLLAGKKKGG
jgi:hypothetical protein